MRAFAPRPRARAGGWAALLFLGGGLAGCSFQPGAVAAPDAHGGGGGGAADAAGVTSDAIPCVAWTFVPSNFDPCSLPPAVPISVAAGGRYTIDTDATSLPHATLAPTDGPPITIVHLSRLDVEGELHTQGASGLVLAVDGEVTLGTAGKITATAGANDGTTCAGRLGQPGAPSTMAGDGGGGGGGGAGGGNGANGGDGNGNKKGAGGAKGAKAGSMLAPLLGGCRGGAGGTENGAGTAGAGGAGGGALQISSDTSITIASGAVLDAAGDGGQAGAPHTGGGGGGGGGGLLVEAPAVTIAAGAVLCADGGSGGQGGGQTVPGGDGVHGACTGASGAATPNNLSYGGYGGLGGYRTAPDAAAGGAASSGSGGGGGGGGGVGWIRLRGETSLDVQTEAVVTPAPG